MLSYLALFCSVVAVTNSRMVRPDAITGSKVRQLSQDQLGHFFGVANALSDDEVDQLFEKEYFNPVLDECPGKKYRIACPGQRRNFNIQPICITAEQLCDQKQDCPEGTDEEPIHCPFYNLRKMQNLAIQRELVQIDTVKDDIARVRQSLARTKDMLLRNRTTRRRMLRQRKLSKPFNQRV